MLKPSVQLEEEQKIAESRILFEEVMVDNEPTQEQVLQRAQQLQIDDLSLARESLTKQLEPFWRPYMNRYGDIYYINLKDRTAYVDHPIDMETKTLYSKRHKTLPPKFRAFQLEDISNSVHLIDEQIKKWKKMELLRSTQTIPSQLNIVYEESEQSNTERQKSSENEYSDDEYIENLQKSQEENTRSRRSSPRQEKESFNIGYKKFPSINQNQNHQEFQESSDNVELTPEYETLLIEYEQQLKKQHQKQLQIYREQKQQNYMKKEELYRQGLKAKMEKYKFNVLSDFETQIEEKNSHNFEKQTHKIIMDYKQKLADFEATLQKEKFVLQKLEQTNEQKQEFIQSLEEKMQRRLNQGKFSMSESLTKDMYKTHFLSKINELNLKSKEDFTKESYKMMNTKLNELIREKGIRDSLRGQKIHSNSLTSFYENIVKRQFEKIDKILLQNQISRQMRKRTKPIFKKAPQTEQIQSHILFVQLQRQISKKNDQKQNDFNGQNILLKNRKQNIIEQIKSDILKSTENNFKFYERRNKIFEKSNLLKTQELDSKNNKEPYERIIRDQKEKKIQTKQNNSAYSMIGYIPDRRSMYLRMMKRIL